MATQRYQVSKLCEQIRRIESIPTSESTFTNEDLTEIMTMELQSSVVPLIQSVREEYFVISEDYVISANTVALNIAPEAIGLRVRDVAIKEPDGSLAYIPRVSPEMHNTVDGYFLRNNQIILCNTYSTDLTLEVSFYKRPNDLSTDVVVVTNKNGSNIVEVNGIPTTWGAIDDDIVTDVIGGIVPFVGRKYSKNSTIKTSTTIELDPTAYDVVVIGDYITLEGTSPVPQYVPVEAYHLLVQGAACRCLEALGDKDGYKLAWQKLGKMEAALVSIINPRVESQSKKITNARSLHRLTSGF